MKTCFVLTCHWPHTLLAYICIQLEKVARDAFQVSNKLASTTSENDVTYCKTAIIHG